MVIENKLKVAVAFSWVASINIIVVHDRQTSFQAMDISSSITVYVLFWSSIIRVVSTLYIGFYPSVNGVAL